MLTARTLNEDDVIHLPWQEMVHKPTQIKIALIGSPCKINLPGDGPNLQLQAGDYVARDGSNLWKLTREEVLKHYEEPK